MSSRGERRPAVQLGDGRTRLTIDVDVGSDPIRGWLASTGAAVEFVGWLELMSALETACAQAPGPGASPAEG